MCLLRAPSPHEGKAFLQQQNVTGLPCAVGVSCSRDQLASVPSPSEPEDRVGGIYERIHGEKACGRSQDRDWDALTDLHTGARAAPRYHSAVCTGFICLSFSQCCFFLDAKQGVWVLACSSRENDVTLSALAPRRRRPASWIFMTASSHSF